MRKQTILFIVLTLITPLVLAACGSVAPKPAASQDKAEQVIEKETIKEETEASVAEADLAAVKTYVVDNGRKMKAGTEAFKATAEQYYILIAKENFNYKTAWANHQAELAALVEQAKADWLEASTYYELNEGIVAGVPSLAFYDIWLDAGPPAADAPDEALKWQLVLADGRVLDSPGNFFHNLAEPALFGTVDEYVGLQVDLDDDGALELGEVLPDAQVLLATAQGLDQATAQLLAAVDAWQPTVKDAFGALVVMTPTMNEYFEQWKLSAFVAGSEQFEETAFVGVSRLFDIKGILNGLNFTYKNISPLAAKANPKLDTQIKSGYEELVGYVGDLYEDEQSGKVFTPEEADLFGTEAQDKATALAGQVSQAAALVGVELTEEEPAIPANPIVITAKATGP